MFKFFKKKNKSEELKSERYFKLKIREVKKETDNASTLIFEKPDNPLLYKPGQFLTLILPIDNKEIRRSYSLSSSPDTDEFPAITVKRVESGIVSNYLNDHMKKGDEFNVMEAIGHFVPDLQGDNKAEYCLFAAGSGITPLLSIIKSILHIEKESRVTLVYQNRDENSVIFKDDLERLSSHYKSRFSVISIFSQPSASQSGYNGRLDTKMLKEIFTNKSESHLLKTEIYLCGPSEFMETVLAFFKNFGLSDKQIHKESFYSGEQKSKTINTTKKQQKAFDVKILLDGEEFEVAVSPDKTILEAALDMNINMPFSCQSGLCTACRGRLLNGEVDMEDEDGLSAEEIKDGYILNCMSKPIGEGVKIEIG